MSIGTAGLGRVGHGVFLLLLGGGSKSVAAEAKVERSARGRSGLLLLGRLLLGLRHTNMETC